GGRDGLPNYSFCPAFSARPAVVSCHYSSSCPIELKKLLRGFGCCFGNFFQRSLSRRCDRFRHDPCVRRFSAFPAKRDGGQIWTIGFHHEFPERDLCRNFSHSGAVFESDNSSERDEVVKTENFICLIERAAEAMKNAADLAGVWRHNLKRVLPGVALMDHDV